MDFELDELQVDLTDGFARLLDARCPSAAVRAIADQPGAVDRALWAELANAGVFSLAVSEDRGGAGLGASMRPRVTTPCTSFSVEAASGPSMASGRTQRS